MRPSITCLLLGLALFLAGCGTFTLAPVTEPAVGEQPTLETAAGSQTTPHPADTAVSSPTPTRTDNETVLAEDPLPIIIPPVVTPPAITPPGIQVPDPTPPQIEVPEIGRPALGQTATAVIAEIMAIEDTPFLARWQPGPFTAGGTAERQVVNIQLLFDASGSMAQITAGERRIDAGRRALNRIIDLLPDESDNLNVGLRLFGHAGGPDPAQQAESCAQTDLLVTLDGVDKPLLHRQTVTWEPNGWTPIALALADAGADFPDGDNMNNVIILVTDGEETCDGDPLAEAVQLAQAGIAVRIEIVGFALDAAAAEAMAEIAAVTGGHYYDTQDGDALVAALEALIEETVWRSSLQIQAYDAGGDLTTNLRLLAIEDEAGEAVVRQPALLANSLANGQARFQLPPGRYDLRLQVYEGPLREGFRPYEAAATYTAVLDPGLETIVPVGIGRLTLVNVDTAANRACRLQLEIEEAGEWLVVYRAGTFVACIETLQFDTAVPLLPGNYRLVDTAVDGNPVLLDNLHIIPGRAITISLASVDS